jgi:hypothetical protein
MSIKLDPRIMGVLEKKLRKKEPKIRDGAIRSRVFWIRKKHGVTINVAAQLLAEKEGFSVLRYLQSEEDQESLRQIRSEMGKTNVGQPSHKKQRVVGKKRIITIAEYQTDDKFLKANIDEINKTYTYGCYTATFVLCRKVLENLIAYHILMRKYPKNKKEHKEKYFDFDSGRTHNFGILLQNLRKSSVDFGVHKKLVERTCYLAGGFKETADEMTHSRYHIAIKNEIDEKKFQYILNLIQELEATIK